MVRSVVLDLGSVSLKVGYSGEREPRRVLPSNLGILFNRTLPLTEAEWSIELGVLLAGVYADQLLCKARNFRLMVVEPLLAPKAFRCALAHVAFEQLHVGHLLLCPQPLAAIHASGYHTGLVLDIGYSETRAVAVALGSPLFATVTTIPIGAETVIKESKRIKTEEAGADDSTTAVENALQHCFVRPLSDSTGESTSGASTKEDNHYRGSSATEILFLDPPASCLAAQGLAGAVLACLDKVPVDLRRSVANAVLVAGGIASMPGLRHRLSEELRLVAGTSDSNDSRFSHLAKCIESSLKVLDPICDSSIATWVGGSVLASVDSSDALVLTRALYGANGAACLPDWLGLNRSTTLFPPPEQTNDTPPTSELLLYGVLTRNQARAVWTSDGDGGWLRAEGEGKRGEKSRGRTKKDVGPRKAVAVAGVGVIWPGDS